jgi:hypothetical protein
MEDLSMASSERKKKDGRDPGKKRRRMRAAVASRKAAAGPRERDRGDQPDVVKYKQGSAADRNRRGAT